MNEQKLLSTPIPWYRTRWFWIIVLALQLALNAFFLNHLLSFDSLLDALNSFATISGSGAVWIVLVLLFNHFDGIHLLTSLIYSPVGIFLTFQTFRKKIVPPAYPLVLLVCMVVTLTIGVLLLSAYS
jgi:hypothetical protein